MIVPRHLSDSKLTLDFHDEGLSAAWKEIKRESEIMREINRFSEISAVSDIRRALDVTYPYPGFDGTTAKILDDIKRQDEMLATGGIVSAMQHISSPALDMIPEMDVRESMMKSVIDPFPVPDHPTPRIPEAALFTPPPNPIHKTNAQIRETNEHLQKTVERLEEIVAQSKGTSSQNSKMIRLSVASLIFTILGTILGTVIGILSYQAGKNSVSAPAMQVAPSHVQKSMP